MIEKILLAAILAAQLCILLVPVGDQRWYAGTHRLTTWWRWLPLYVSPVLSCARGWPFRLGIAVGLFGRVVWVARLER